MITTTLIEAIPLLQEALVRHFESGEQITITTVLSSLENLPQLLETEQPDLLWLDGTTAGVKDNDFIRNLRKKAPATKILLFGSGETVPEIKNYFKHGIHAYLPKTATASEIRLAIEAVIADNLYVPPSLHHTFTSWLTDPVRKKKPGHKLTQREKEVLRLIVEEHTTNEIAKKLFISQCTVETHRVNLIQKLGVKNTAGLVRVAFEAGLYTWGML